MSQGFWQQTQKALNNQDSVLKQTPIPEPELDLSVLDQFQEPQEEPDEEDDMSEVLNNANLRLEQGRLYQMIMNHDIFGDTNADPKAIKNVQREIRKFARERMEIMLGMRHEAQKEVAVVSSPFNDLEVLALKTIAAQMSKGATTRADNAPIQTLTAPKKDGINTISGTTKYSAPAPISNPLPKNRPAAPKTATSAKSPPKTASASVVNTDQTLLTKPIGEMTPEELKAYDDKVESRHNNLKAALPTNMVPMPSPDALAAMYTTRTANVLQSPGFAISSVLSLLNQNR